MENIIPTDFLLSRFFVVHVTICKKARKTPEIGVKSGVSCTFSCTNFANH